LRIVLCLFLICSFICRAGLASPQIRINIPEYQLTVIDKGQVIKKYDIAVGTPYEQTPTGNFAIFLKQEYPVWFPGSRFADRTPVPPGPDNPLGSRWMEFFPSYGIHGTNTDWSISCAVSSGCIRMHDRDARELYDLVDVGTPVTVVYETLLVTEKADGLYLKVLPDIYARKTSTPERLQELFAPFAAGYRLIAPEKTLLREADDSYEIKFAVRQDSPASLSRAKTPPTPTVATPAAGGDAPFPPR